MLEQLMKPIITQSKNSRRRQKLFILFNCRLIFGRKSVEIKVVAYKTCNTFIFMNTDLLETKKRMPYHAYPTFPLNFRPYFCYGVKNLHFYYILASKVFSVIIQIAIKINFGISS